MPDGTDTGRAPAAAPWMEAKALSPTRDKVRELLMSSDAFRKLEPAEKTDIAKKMVKVAAYMANPDGLAAEELSPATENVLQRDPGPPPSEPRQASPVARRRTLPPPPLAEAQRGRRQTPTRVTQGAVREGAGRASGDHGFAGEDFVGGATEHGVDQFGEMVQTVDFPAFVGGLIENVFQAIVDSSIQQMRAYGELLANVAKTVDEFAADNITTNNARDWLTDAFPDGLGVEVGGAGGFGDLPGLGAGFADDPFGEGEQQPRLVAKGDEPEAQLRQISETLQMENPVTDLSDADQEARLVQAARLHIARSRQRLLASMVILGINRIVVTDGHIKAKVVFGMRSHDLVARGSRASLYDKQSSSGRRASAAGGWFGGWGGARGRSSRQSHMTTVRSSLDERSESQAELKAQLSGDVRVNFKSDYFPMESLADPEMIAAIQGNAAPSDDGVVMG